MSIDMEMEATPHNILSPKQQTLGVKSKGSSCAYFVKNGGRLSQKMGCFAMLGVSGVLRKLSLIFWGVVISFLLSTQVGSTQPLVITPSSLSFTISPGGVDTCYVEVLDLDSPFFSVKYDFDSGWMFLFPSEFKISPGEAKRILAVFFIPKGENAQREGQIETKDERAYIAWIGIEYKNSYVKVRPFCFNNTSEDEVLRYKLEAKKSGKSGIAHTCQSGSVCIPSQEEKRLSQLTLGISPKDCYQIKLEVYKEGKLVAEDSVFYP